MPGSILAFDQGTTSSRAIVFGADLSIRGLAQREFAQHYPAPGMGRARPRGHLAHHGRDRASGGRSGGSRRRRHRRGRHHQPARDLPHLGPAHGQAHPPRHRLAGPAHRRPVPPPEGRGARAAVTARDRAAARPLFLGHQDRLAARPRGGRPAAGRGRAPRLRHRRHVPGLAAHRRQGARHRRHQRLAHAALRHRQGRLGRRPAASCSRIPRAILPEVRDCNADFGTDRAVDPRRRAADPGRRRRPAGRDHRPGLLRARHGEGHLRHRLLRAAQHRRDCRSPPGTGC